MCSYKYEQGHIKIKSRSAVPVARGISSNQKDAFH